MRKILTAQIRQIYYLRLRHELFPEEYKGYHKGTREMWSTVHWSTNPQREQSEAENINSVDCHQRGQRYIHAKLDNW